MPANAFLRKVRQIISCILKLIGVRRVSYISQIVEYIRKAQELASKHGIRNLLQPGMVKELIVADILGHEVHRTKHEPDAWDPKNPSKKFEYLTCFEHGTFQLERMFKSPPDKRAKSLERITRNAAIFCVVFEEETALEVIVIYKVDVATFLSEVERQLDASSNEISHVGITIKWCEENGKVVYRRDA